MRASNGTVAVVAICVALALVAEQELSSQEVQADARAVVAVVPFAGDGFPESVREAIREAVTAEIGKVEYLSLVERERLDQVFAEQNLQLSGVTDPDTVVEVGMLANAAYIVTGSVTQSGMTLSISGRVVDVQSGEIVTSESVIAAGESDVHAAAQTLARHLVNRMSDTVVSVDVALTAGPLSDRAFYPELVDLLGDRRFDSGDYGRVRSISYELTRATRSEIATEFEKQNAPLVTALNIVPLAPGSALIDHSYGPFSAQLVGGLFALGPDPAYSLAGVIVAVGGYIWGFVQPSRDQAEYNGTLDRALSLE